MFSRVMNTFYHFWLLASARKKFSVCPKNNGFAQLRGDAAPSPLARTPIYHTFQAHVKSSSSYRIVTVYKVLFITVLTV